MGRDEAFTEHYFKSNPLYYFMFAMLGESIYCYTTFIEQTKCYSEVFPR
jgi:hypothetical protein